MPLNKHTSRHMHAYGFDRTMISFSFFPNGTGVPAVASMRGRVPAISSLVYTSTGLFTLTFDDNIVDTDFIAMIGSVQSNAAVGLHVEFGPYVAATKSITIRTMVGNTLTDIAASANSRVSLLFVMATRGDNK